MSFPVHIKSAINFLRRWLEEQLRGKGAECPVCRRDTRVDERSIHASQARALRRLVQLCTSPDIWIHTRDLGGDQDGKGGFKVPDFPNLLKWGLIERVPKDVARRLKLKRPRGCYRITQKGRDFVSGRITVPKYVRSYYGQILGFTESERLSFSEALKQEFDEAKLLASRPCVAPDLEEAQ